jgi:hypothetical protein
VITGAVEKFVAVNPPQINLRGIVGDTVKTKVMVVPQKKYPFKILNARAKNGEYINFQVEESKQSHGTAYEVQVENLKKEPGSYYDAIILETDSELKPEFEIRVYGHLNPRSQK